MLRIILKYNNYGSRISKLLKKFFNSRLEQGSIKTVQLNFGPQHPASHGILRLAFQLSGEFIRDIDLQYGLLHRGTEKLIESKTVIQALPYFDRFDYVANLFQEHIFCIAVESLINFESFDYFIHIIRTLFDELSRVLNHLLTLSASILDIGAMGSIFWAFEEREKIMEFFERISGARMHTALFRPNFFDFSLISNIFLLDLSKFILKSSRILNSTFLSLLNNRIFKTRLCNVGVLTPSKITSYCITGIIARSAGLKDDLRLQKDFNYGFYWQLNFKSFFGVHGDNYDRFLIRIREILESLKITTQLIQNFWLFKKNIKINKIERHKGIVIKANKKSIFLKITFFNFNIFFFCLIDNSINSFIFNNNFFKNEKLDFNINEKFFSMEDLILHFKNFSDSYLIPEGITYNQIESPKGYLGLFLISDNSKNLYRCKLRSPVAYNMNTIHSVCSGLSLADFISTFCSLDIVLGEIDR